MFKLKGAEAPFLFIFISGTRIFMIFMMSLIDFVFFVFRSEAPDYIGINSASERVGGAS
jgi:hypothetical protein